MKAKQGRFNLAAVALTFSLGAMSISAQTVVSATRYDQMVPSSDSPIPVLRDGAGNFFVVSGTGLGMVVTKYNSLWTAQWRKFYLGGENHPIKPATSVVDPAGDLVVVGLSTVGASSTNHLTVVRLASSNGAQIYETTPLGTAGAENVLFPAAVDSSGNVGFTGFHSPDGVSKMVATAMLVNYSSGALKWSTALPSTDGVATFGKMKPDASGDWYVAGGVYGPNTIDSCYAGWRLRASDGAAIWRYQITPGATQTLGTATDVAFAKNGNPVFVGHGLENSGAWHPVTLMVDRTTGGMVWMNSDPITSSNDYLEDALVEPTTGDIIVGGCANGGWQPMVMRLSAETGVRQWLGRFIGATSTPMLGGSYMRFDGKDGVVLGSQGFSSSTSRMGVYTCDFNLASGALNWEKKFPTVTGKTDRIAGIFPEGNSVVIVGSTDSGAIQLQDIFFQRLNIATGAQRLLALENIPKAGDSSPVSYAAGPGGTSVISGQYSGDLPTGSENPSSGALLVYYNADGTIRWTRATATDPAMKGPFKKMVIDSAGNVYGATNTPSVPSDMYLVKLSGVDGSMLWENTYNTPGSQTFDEVMAMTLTSDGDPVLTGSGNSTFATVRFAADTGVQQWVHTFTAGVTGAIDVATTVCATANGDVFVAGWSWRPVPQATMFRLKGADGTQVWRATYDISGDAERELPLWSGVATNGDLMLAGNINPNDGPYKVYAQRINGATGGILWTNIQSTPNGGMTTCSMTPGGDLLVSAKDSTQILAFKILSSGALGWAKSYSVGVDYVTEPKGATVDDFGNLIVGGYGHVNATGAMLPLLVSLSGDDGHTLWDHPYQYPGAEVTIPFDLRNAPDGNVLLVSQARFPGPYGNAQDLFLTRIQPLDVRSRTFTGTVQLSDMLSSGGRSLTIDIRLPGSSSIYATKTVTLDSNGLFSAAIDLKDGNYDITVRSPHFLQKRFANIAAATNVSLGTMALINGDVNGDNRVDNADQTALTAAFRSTSAKANWNPNADLNGDGQVSASDQAILSKNFGKVGD